MEKNNMICKDCGTRFAKIGNRAVRLNGDKIIVSYGDKVKDKIIELKKNLNIDTSTNNIRLMINKIFGSFFINL